MIKKKIISLALLIFILYQFSSLIFSQWSKYTSPYYTETTYKAYEATYNSSQYRVKEHPGFIPDETVFSYAAGAYLRGVDPILINSEHTPLGKYFLSLSIFLFKNEKTSIIFFGIFTLSILWLLGKKVLHDNMLALIPVAIFSLEKLFIGQFMYTPLLDIIQLPFILLTLHLFLIENKKQRYFLTAISLGLVMATKTTVPAILLIISFSAFFILKRHWKNLIYFYLSLPLAIIVFSATYFKTFLGHSLWEFIGFQKWIFLYQQSKLIFPLSVWKLIFLNQWQTWWADMRVVPVDDWQITWPIFTILPFLLVMFALKKKIKVSDHLLVLMIWIFIYDAFLSLGIVYPRFLLPLLPILYIVGTYFLASFYTPVAKITANCARRLLLFKKKM